MARPIGRRIWEFDGDFTPGERFNLIRGLGDAPRVSAVFQASVRDADHSIVERQVVRFFFPPVPDLTGAATIVPPVEARLDAGISLASDTAAGTPGPAHSIEEDDAPRMEAVFAPLSSLDSAPPYARVGGTQYIVAFAEDLQTAIVYDKVTMAVLAGGPGDFPELGAGRDDVFTLSGDFSAGGPLPGGNLAGIDRFVLRGGNDYNLIADDNSVAAGQTLEIDAQPLGPGNHVMFDGSAETDGRFAFFGSDGGDFFFGGAGDDRIVGMRGADALTGGGGNDIFVYRNAGDSSGTSYDTLAGFDPAADRIDLPGTVAGFAGAIEGGTLSYDTFNDDLALAVGDLGASQAVWFAPDQGDLAGQIFLIVDGNGQPGYQEGEDFVIAVGGSPLADLTGNTDIFI